MERLDLIGGLAIKQGLSYQQTLLWPGDVSSGTPRAIVRENYKYTDAEEKFSFSFLPLVYPVKNSQDVDCTEITLFLTAEETAAIAVTRYQGNKEDLIVKRAYVWDLEIELPDGQVVGLPAGFIQVKPEVT